ncbi:butyryl-CoA dehydrogenase [Thozetella sp. PMI_491]|nr:butyryl-CoA dehydrogenase [Thozetella sp. PMI_491]
MNFELPQDLQAYLDKIDAFIQSTILPLQKRDDNNRFFDHRREASRTQWDKGGLPAPEWDALLARARSLADQSGFLRFAFPVEYGGSGHPTQNLWMCAIRYFLASNPEYGGGVSLANDLQNEHSIIANNPFVIMLHHYGSAEQKKLISQAIAGEFRCTFGLTEIHHGSDATHLDTTAKPVTLADGTPGYEIDGNKKWQTGTHVATHHLIFARTSGRAGSAKGITAFIVPHDAPGVCVESYEWTLNMPTDHATITLTKVLVPATAILGALDNGLSIAQTFTHENRIRQAASSCGAAKYCIDASVAYANARSVFGKPLSANQAIQWPLVELATQHEMLRLLILRTATEMDAVEARCAAEGKPPWVAIEKELGGRIGMCNYYANRLCCEAADRAIQVHGGMGYSRHLPFEHIWRHFRRYRITEGSEEVQMRRVAAELFGYKGSPSQGKGKGPRL